jgi:hypothetical protein
MELIGLLRRLDAYCPPEAIIRVLLGNHSALISQETMACQATRPGRFEHVSYAQAWLPG